MSIGDVYPLLRLLKTEEPQESWFSYEVVSSSWELFGPMAPKPRLQAIFGG